MTNQNSGRLTARQSYIRIIEQQTMLANRYCNIRRIDHNAGAGTFSLVFTADDITLKKKIILKFFDPSWYGDRQRFDYFCRESEILKDLQGQRNILPLIQEKTDVNLIVNPASGMTFPFYLHCRITH